MYDPFKRARSKTRKKMRRASSTALSALLGAMLAPSKPAKPAKPAKRRPSKPAKPAVRTATRAAKPPSGTGTPRGGAFVKGVHTCEFGERPYRLYVPAAARTAVGPPPVMVMLHGCGQTPEDFARGTGMNALAEEFGFLVLYPAQERTSQIHRCWNWYRRGDQARGAGEPALLASLVRRIVSERAADPAKVYVAGLSAGASAALIVATAYPDIFAGAGVHSGLPAGAAHDEATAIYAMRHGAPGRRHADPMPTIVFHGGSDRVVNPRNGRFVAARALDPYVNLRRTEKTGTIPDGRRYVRTSHRLGTGRSFTEHWVVDGAGHAWSGGNASGSFTDPKGPDASREMVRFLMRHRTTAKRRSAPPGRPGGTGQ